MPRLAPFLLLFLLIAAPLPAAISNNPFIVKMVGYYQRIASAFGCPSLGNSSYDEALAILEFLPQNQNFNGWTRLFTANVLPLPQTEAEVAPRMIAFRKNLLDTLAASGQLVDVRDIRTKSGRLPVTYIEYIAGSGAEREHAVGVFARHSALLAAFTQIQIRNGDPGEADKANMRQLAINMAKR